MKSVFKMTLAVSLAALALSAVASTSAQAASTNNPQWSVGKAILGAGESQALEVSQNGAIVLGIFGGTIDCRTLKVETPAAKIIGSTAPAAGTGEETLVFGECEERAHPGCEINQKKAGSASIKTELLKSTLVYETKAGAESETGATLTLLQPKTGQFFAWIELSGSCGFTGYFPVTGQIAAKNVNGGEESASQSINFPETHITKYFVNEAGKTVEKKVTNLTYAGAAMSWIFQATEKLTSKKLFKILG